jgi:hypothetical protein
VLRDNKGVELAHLCPKNRNWWPISRHALRFESAPERRLFAAPFTELL